MDLDRHRADNLANWNDRVRVHTAADGYDIERLVSDTDRLSDVVAFDRAYLGDVSGRTLVHPQCHIGTDTLSWAKLGAMVTGIDFSAPALESARDLARRLAVDATFIESELYAIPDIVTDRFDIVYTGVGAVNWLPDIRGWAKVMAHLTKPGGRFYIREGHPMLWSLDLERDDDLLVVSEPYFETDAPATWNEATSYTGSGTLENTTTHEWNHGLGEIVNALIGAGFRIDLIEEHRFLEWPALPMMIEDHGRYRMPGHLADRVPLMYSLLATRYT